MTTRILVRVIIPIAAAAVATVGGAMCWLQLHASGRPKATWIGLLLLGMAGALCAQMWATSVPAHAIITIHLVVALLPLAMEDGLTCLMARDRIFALYPGTAALLIVMAAIQPTEVSLLGAAVAAATVWLIFVAMASLGSLGFGDVRLAPVLGAHLGALGATTAITGIIAAFFLGAVLAGVLHAIRRMPPDRRIPFCPSLLCGSVVAVMLA